MSVILRGFPCRVTRVNDLVYTSPDGEPLLADLYLPDEPPRPLPVILWLHAGGWRAGDRRFGPDLARFFAERGLAMASIDYRLSTQAIFPAALDDVKAAIKWLGVVANTYGLDTDRIGLWGASAGGHLAALAALSGDTQPVRAVAAGYPPVDFLQMDAQRDPSIDTTGDPEAYHLPAHRKAADGNSYESRFLGAPIETIPEIARQASPVAFAHPQAPPFLLVHGLNDTAVPWQQSQLLYDALRAHDNDVTLALIDRLGHGFLNRNDFDQGPARRVRQRRSRQGEPEHISETPPFTFGTIETFFKRHLSR